MSDIKTVIQKDDPIKMVEIAEREGRSLAQVDLSTNQLRNVFGQVRQIQAMWRIPEQRAQAERLLQLLKPRVSYQAAKERKVEKLRDIVIEAIDAVYGNTQALSPERDQQFHRFTEFLEAIVAYHQSFTKGR